MEDTAATFLENFKQCCRSSCGRLSDKMAWEDAAFQTASRDCDALYRQIEEKLGEDYKLMNRYDAAKNNELDLDREFIYQQGFQDCIALLRWLGLF